MPIYTFKCPQCGHIEAPIMNFTEYDELDSMECTSCHETLTKANRDISGDNITKVVIGVGKGNFGSGDYS